MKIKKSLLAIFSVFFFNAAHAEPLILADTSLSRDTSGSAYIELPHCPQLAEIKIKAIDKIELKKVLATFESGKDKNIIYAFATLEPNETTGWRSLGHYATKSCVKNILVHGYSKHAENGRIQVLAKS